ncbi:polysaccharide biosynthesis protein [Geobacter sp. OR-1]|uniref:flippase n=1 Tax=Geobacter sp. OR-1 TaxID=1266765 RepID=UPI0005443AB7|nr:flippase [Geobacter sp. OR-1]GAM08018.1 polysaccharide biosynthesis protein [Geobacter sp. OR-1]
MNSAWTGYLPGIIREWLEGRPHLRKAVGNTGWLLFDRVLRMIIGVSVGAWVARYLGPARFGELAYIIAFIAFFQVIAGLEADGFIVRDIARNQGDTGVILGTSLRLRIVSGIVCWLTATGMMYLFHPDDTQICLMTVIVGAMLVFQASDTVDLWFESQSQSKRTVLAKLASYLFANGLRVFLLLTKAPLIAFAGVISLESAALAVALFVAYRRFPTDGRWRADIVQAKKLLHLCWPLATTGVMITAYMRIDQIMLKEMLGEKELGIYAAALTLVQVWNVIPATLVASLAPFVARMKSRGETEYQDALVIIFRFFAIVAFLGAGLTAVASPWVVSLLYGAEFRSSAVLLSALVFVIIFIFQGMAQTLWVINNDVRIANLVGTFLAALVSVIANFFLIRKFGIMGAVFSYLLAQGASVVLFPCLLRRDLLTLYTRAFLGFGSRKQ